MTTFGTITGRVASERRSRLISRWFGFVAGAFFGAATYAGTTPVGTLRVVSGAGLGGEIRVTNTGFVNGFRAGSLDSASSTFETFSLERYESLGAGGEYSADSSDRTTAGAGNFFYNGVLPNDHGGRHDVLSDQTAYLYEKFITHALSNYDYNDVTLRAKDSESFQSAIWYLEKELDRIDDVQATRWLDEANAAVRNGYRNQGQVQVLNLYTTGTGRNDAQDLVVYVPLPQASWAGLLVLGLVGIGHIRRARINQRYS